MRYKLFLLLCLGFLMVGTGIAQSSYHEEADSAVIGPRDAELDAMIKDLRVFLNQTYGPEKAGQKQYVGNEYCYACHSWARNIYPSTGHAHYLTRLMPDEADPIAKAFLDGTDFNQMSGTAFDAFKPNAPILWYGADKAGHNKFWMTIGDLNHEVVFMQVRDRFGVRIPVADGTGWSGAPYFAPVRYSNGAWGSYGTNNWWTGNTPKWTPATTTGDLAAGGPSNYSLSCAGCHITGIRQVGYNANGEFFMRPYPASLYNSDDPRIFDYDGDGIFDLVNIGCESCHGGGSAHIMGGGDPAGIVNPNLMTGQQSTDLCGRCHTRAYSVPNGTFSFPSMDDPFVDLTPDQILNGATPWTWGDPYYRLWPDGKTPSYARPYDEFMQSSKPTFAFHQVYCAECHSPHSKRQEAQIVTRITEHDYYGEGQDLRINTEVENNTLCLACHATHGPFEELSKEQIAFYADNEEEIAKVVSAHTHHPYAPERMMGLSRCVYCHMTAMAGHPSHTFEAVSPQKTLDLQGISDGMPNSCAMGCHNVLVNLWGLGIDTNNIWNEPFDIANAETLAMYFHEWWPEPVKAHK